MANIKMLQNREVLKDLTLQKDKIYEVLDIVQDSYKIAVPMKRKGKFKYVLIGEDEGELLDE